MLGIATIISGCHPAAKFSSQAAYADARIKLKRGEISAALQEAEQALQRYGPEQPEWHWRFRVLKAEALARQGLNKESLELLAAEPPPALATSEAAVRRKLVEGVDSIRLQRAAEAVQFIRQAEGLAKANHPELLADVFSGKAVISFLGGDLAGAEEAYGDSLRIAQKQNDVFIQAAALGGLGLIATKREHYDESIELDQAAVRLAESVGAQNTLAAALGNMAWCYKKLGDLENALTFYKQAEQVSAQSGQLGLKAYWLTGLANVYYDNHDYASAEAVLAEGLELARRQGDKRTLLEYVNALAEIALTTGRSDLAEKYLAEAADLQSQTSGHSGVDRSELLASTILSARIHESRREFSKAEESLNGVIRDPEADTDTEEKWEAEARLAEVYADEGRSARADSEFRHALATIESVRSSVQAEDLRMSFLSRGIDFYDGYIAFLISQGRTQDALQAAELSRARTLAEGLGIAPKTVSFPLRGFDARLLAQRSHATLLFYWLGQNKSYLWAITSRRVQCIGLPGAPQIDSLVKSYNQAVLNGRDVLAENDPNGEKLYNVLIEPAKKMLAQDARVIVLPDGSLYSLNFETLLVPGPKPHFWIEHVTLSTAGSLALLAGKFGTVDAAGKLLLVGNAVQAAPEFPVLRQAATEMEDIERYFPEPRRTILQGPQATSTAFLASQPEKFSYIHFVTHGTASRAHPLDSAVILSPDGGAYKLYAWNIVKRPLSAELVTISACNSAGTRAYSGEGLVGLSWAFLRAGAHNVISALWEVNDISTPQLMNRMYAELSQGRDPALALRTAKLSLLRSDSVFKKPFYWAPFQLYSRAQVSEATRN